MMSITAACQKEAFPLAGSLPRSKPVEQHTIARVLVACCVSMSCRDEGFSYITTREDLSGVVTRAETGLIILGRLFVGSGVSGAALDDWVSGFYLAQFFVSSLAFFRWRRLISPAAAVTRKPAVLSPSSFSFSMFSITSCGILTVVICDFAFFAPVAIAETPYVRCMSVYAENMIIEYLKCISFKCSFKCKGEIHLIKAKPRSARTLTGLLTTSDRSDIEVAILNHITPFTGRNSHTPNKFTWRFMAISRLDREAKPCRLSVEAHTEREARKVLAPHFILSFAARLPVKGIEEITIPTAGAGYGHMSTPSTIAISQHLQDIGEITIPSTVTEKVTVTATEYEEVTHDA